ncbi:MAG: T9SS type A sorting domain-containing protein, partial [Bacteroidales bacterium]|nr:T9SS type A sorting domain-containing protein [Bacteroidales bacterium]
EGESYDITGPLNYDFDEWKIELRFENDVIIGNDITAPTISSLFTVNDTLIKLTFSEDLEEISAETTGNYSINNGVNVLGANQHALQKSVVYLTISKLVDGDYILTINNVEDLAGNAMENVLVEFSYEGFGINDIDIANASVYPNPVNSTLNCEFISSGNTNLLINISDLAGREIVKTSQSLVNGQNNFSIFLGDQKSGIYLLEMKTNDKVFREKIMIE